MHLNGLDTPILEHRHFRLILAKYRQFLAIIASRVSIMRVLARSDLFIPLSGEMRVITPSLLQTKS